MSRKQRLDEILVARGLAPTREKAQVLILAGKVRIHGERAKAADVSVSDEDEVLVDETPRFVSRAGDKLDAAFTVFGLTVSEKVCADVGAATGGFTDVLLQRGASKVYAVDVGYGDLHWKVRSNPRVIPIERTNARYLETLPEKIDFACIDVSFIGLRQIIPPVRGWLKDGGEIVALIKPQFEVKPEEVPEGGVVQDPALHQGVVTQIREWSVKEGFVVGGEMASPVIGISGNREFLIWLRS